MKGALSMLLRGRIVIGIMAGVFASGSGCEKGGAGAASGNDAPSAHKGAAAVTVVYSANAWGELMECG